MTPFLPYPIHSPRPREKVNISCCPYFPVNFHTMETKAHISSSSHKDRVSSPVTRLQYISLRMTPQ